MQLNRAYAYLLLNALAACVLLSLLSNVTSAATILTSPAEFTTQTVFVGFETFPSGSAVDYNQADLTDQWRVWGVRISDDSPADGASAFAGNLAAVPHSGTRAIWHSSQGVPGGFVDFDFVIPGTSTPGTASEAGLWVQVGSGIVTVEFFDSMDVMLESFVRTTLDSFVGIRAPEGISRVRVGGTGFWLVDDVEFAPVPEPTTAVCAVGAMAALVGFARGCRRRRGDAVKK